ncbi:hypothetical protein EVAR_32754_1 [Eumeta japonica]|uniref:Uncharacterized protein n=1 Tax=Eumeta variegata TaxID=151549 RepID=A0A4C1XL21_EUMVA|nr:hypothetical protein EVAR_32754_1 [Eumeta japonica]
MLLCKTHGEQISASQNRVRSQTCIRRHLCVAGFLRGNAICNRDVSGSWKGERGSGLPEFALIEQNAKAVAVGYVVVSAHNVNNHVSMYLRSSTLPKLLIHIRISRQ